MNIIISIDAGGTLFKSALIDASSMQVIAGTSREAPSYSSDERSNILKALYSVVNGQVSLMDMYPRSRLERIVFSFPGPFDYVNGRCMMQHKFQAIYGLSLTPLLRKFCNIPDILPIVYHHDLHSFTYGTYLYEINQKAKSLFCVAIGTGLGTGFLKEGHLEMGSGGGIPKYPLFQEKIEGGILEDVVSNRGGLVDLYNQYSGIKNSIDAKEIQRRADIKNDANAFKAYETMGIELGNMLYPLLQKLQVDTLIIGGQISKGFHLFGPSMLKKLEVVSTLKKIQPVTDVVTTTIRGGAASIPISVYHSYSTILEA